jgi:hypothetical protein
MDKDYNEYSKIAVRADSYQKLKTIVVEQVANPHTLSQTRLQYAKKLAGTLDGNASARIIDYLLNNK